MIKAIKSLQFSLFILFFFVFQINQSKAQFTATWGLTSTTLKTCLVEGIQSANITAGDMIPGTTFDPLGGHNIDGYKCAIASGNWPTVATDGHSIDFPLAPVSSNDLTVTGLTLTARTSGGSGSNLLSVAYQVDGAGSWISFGSVQTANSGGTTSINFGTLATLLPSGHTYMIRLYAYASGTTTSSRKLYIKNVVFSGTTLSSSLPVNISRFSVKCNQLNQSVISWTAQTETGVLNYEIENSIDGITFKSIKKIDPKNNQNGTISYEYIHNESQAIVLFYRLKIINVSGDVKYSSIQKSICVQKNELANIAPNPILNKIVNVNLEHYSQGDYTILIFNESGRLIQREIYQLTSGFETLPIKMRPTITHGNYILEIIGGKKSTILKFTL